MGGTFQILQSQTSCPCCLVFYESPAFLIFKLICKHRPKERGARCAWWQLGTLPQPAVAGRAPGSASYFSPTLSPPSSRKDLPLPLFTAQQQHARGTFWGCRRSEAWRVAACVHLAPAAHHPRQQGVASRVSPRPGQWGHGESGADTACLLGSATSRAISARGAEWCAGKGRDARGALASGTHQEPPGPTRTHPDSLTLCPIAPRRPCSAPTGWGLALVETHLQTQAWRTTPWGQQVPSGAAWVPCGPRRLSWAFSLFAAWGLMEPEPGPEGLRSMFGFVEALEHVGRARRVKDAVRQWLAGPWLEVQHWPERSNQSLRTFTRPANAWRDTPTSQPFSDGNHSC